jgi:hypothetical protein
VSGGHRPKEILNWTDTEQQLAAGAAMKIEQWRLQQIGKMLGGK